MPKRLSDQTQAVMNETSGISEAECIELIFKE